MNNQFDFIQGSQKHIEQAIARYHNNIEWLKTRKDQYSLLIDLQNVKNPPPLTFDENNYANVNVAGADLYEIKEQGSEKYYKKLSNEDLGIVHDERLDVTLSEQNPLSDLRLLKANLFYELGGADTTTFPYGGNLEHDPAWHYTHSEESKATEVNMLKEKYDPNTVYKNAFISTILGIGLGYHLKEFIQRTTPNLVFIAEVSNIYIYLSLFCINYKSIFDKIPDGNLMIRSNANPKTLWDDYRGFIHYKSRLAFFRAPICLNKLTFFAKSCLLEIFKKKVFLYSLYGFYTDQAAMHANTAFNFKHGKTLISKKRETPKDTPVFIIGSGASIAHDLDFLKKNKDKALIVACGSSLDLLINNGIQPDFYVWLERENSWHDRFINKDIDLSNVVLISPLTTVGTQGVNRLTRTEGGFLTGRTIIRNIFPCNFKYEISATRSTNAFIWDPELEYTLPFEGTTVTNLALSFMDHFNFQNIYLFGTDFGRKGMLDHHIQDVTDTYSEGALKLLSNNINATSKDVRANFGGLTTTMYPYNRGLEDMSLFMNEVNREHTNLTVYNCADGAYIDKTIATFSDSITLKELPKNKASILDDLYKEQQIITSQDVQEIWKTQFSEDELHLLLKEVKKFYKNVDWFSSNAGQDYHNILKNLLSLARNLVYGTMYDIFVYGLLYMEKLKPEYRKKGQKILTKHILDAIDRIELTATMMFTSLNVYLLKNEELPKQQKRDILLSFHDQLHKSNKDSVNVSKTYLKMREGMAIDVLDNILSKAKLKVLAENYNKYINEATAINILSHGLKVSFVSLKSKRKLFNILNSWIENTKDQTFISTINEIYTKHFNANPVLSPHIDVAKYVVGILSSDQIPTDYKEYLLKHLNVIDEYNSIEKLASIDMEKDLEEIIEQLNCKKDYHYLMDQGEVLFDIIRKPMDVEEAQFILFAEEALPIVVDYYLENMTTTMEYDLLDNYYKLIEEQLKDTSISLYERSNTMAMDWFLCAIIEEKVLENKVHKDILSTDIYKETFKINNEISHIVSNVEYLYYTARWNSTYSFDINMEENITKITKAIKMNRLLLQQWKTHQL